MGKVAQAVKIVKVGNLEVELREGETLDPGLMEFLNSEQQPLLGGQEKNGETLEQFQERLNQGLVELAVGRLLAEGRQQRGLTTRQLAERLSWNQSRISQLEHAVNPELATLCLIAGTLGYRLKITLEPLEGGESISAEMPTKAVKRWQ